MLQEDIDEQTMTASDFKALATGNPYLKYKMELENDLTLLENQDAPFNAARITIVIQSLTVKKICPFLRND